MSVLTQVGYTVSYKGHRIGAYVADLVVENRIIVELKCVENFSNEHMAKCLNYSRRRVSASPSTSTSNIQRSCGNASSLAKRFYSCSFVFIRS